MSMITDTAPQGRNFQALIDAIAPRRARRDPLGLFAGYRAYLVYTELSSKSDRELQRMGLERVDLPRVAFDAAFGRQAA